MVLEYPFSLASYARLYMKSAEDTTFVFVLERYKSQYNIEKSSGKNKKK